MYTLCTHTHPLHSEAVPPDVYRKKPMCMSQYPMYSKCRIPHPGVDRIRQTPISESRHILVMRNGHVSLGYLTALCVHDIRVDFLLTTCTCVSAFYHTRMLYIVHVVFSPGCSLRVSRWDSGCGSLFSHYWTATQHYQDVLWPLRESSWYPDVWPPWYLGQEQGEAESRSVVDI